MSGGPKSTFSYTTITKPEVTTISSGQLSPEERGCLIFYESGCTTFTIVFNSYLIYVVICKVALVYFYLHYLLERPYFNYLDNEMG